MELTELVGRNHLAGYQPAVRAHEMSMDGELTTGSARTRSSEYLARYCSDLKLTEKDRYAELLPQ